MHNRNHRNMIKDLSSFFPMQELNKHIY
uniref:Uncharacterized protein n=1 Tax=Arundo donax TaxID=35708 RepID=A0A0A8ZCV7_ARUDO